MSDGSVGRARSDARPGTAGSRSRPLARRATRARTGSPGRLARALQSTHGVDAERSLGRPLGRRGWGAILYDWFHSEEKLAEARDLATFERDGTMVMSEQAKQHLLTVHHISGAEASRRYREYTAWSNDYKTALGEKLGYWRWSAKVVADWNDLVTKAREAF